MLRTYLSVSLILTVLLIFGGCAKKHPTAEVSPPAPAAPAVVSTPVEPEPVVAPSIEAIIQDEGVQLATVLFEYDSYALTARGEQVLKKNLDWLVANPDVKILIEGHCDERGSDEYNLALGEKRALSTKNFFIGLGVAPERLSIISYGEENPVSRGHNEIAWEQNRRVEFK